MNVESLQVLLFILWTYVYHSTLFRYHTSKEPYDLKRM